MANKNKLVALSPRQDSFIRAEAERLGITTTEVIRRILDAALEVKNGV